MADAGHIKELGKGAAHWNAWRLANPQIIPDLEGSSCEAVFQHLKPSNGTPINFLNANIKSAVLSQAMLIGADLKGADLSSADLTGAQLQDADLSFADISNTRFGSADVQNTNFFKANIRGADLSNVKNLATRQIEMAFGDKHTNLPADIQMPKSWQNPSLKNINFDDFSENFPLGTLSQSPDGPRHDQLISNDAQQQGYAHPFGQNTTTLPGINDSDRVVADSARYVEQQRNHAHRQRARGLIAAVAICVIGVCLARGFWVMNMAHQHARMQAENEAWTQAQGEATTAALQKYLARYPEGQHSATARRQVAALEAKAAKQRADEKAWADAQSTGTAAAFKAYLARHGDGGHTATAREQLAALEAKAAKQRADDELLSKSNGQETATKIEQERDGKPIIQKSRVEKQNIKKSKKKTAKLASRSVRKARQKTKIQRKKNRKNKNPWPSPDEPFLGPGIGF